jgi:hypothetical protein
MVEVITRRQFHSVFVKSALHCLSMVSAGRGKMADHRTIRLTDKTTDNSI